MALLALSFVAFRRWISSIVVPMVVPIVLPIVVDLIVPAVAGTAAPAVVDRALNIL
jgi:hypothetical protein